VSFSPAGAGAARPARSRRRWVVAGLLVAWAVGLAIAAGWSAHHDPATVREQSTFAQGSATLDDAVDTVVAAAGPGVRAEVGAREITEGCRLTLARQGTEIDRTVVLAVPEGQEPALLDRLAERLPPEWDPRHFRGSSRLRADAGDFVAVVGEVDEPGRVAVTFRTGCRPD
jgi:hypothetical protein